jgi:hypothetical protein
MEMVLRITTMTRKVEFIDIEFLIHIYVCTKGFKPT